MLTGRTFTIKATSAVNSQSETVATEEVPTSVSATDTNGQLRLVDGHYMYNLATKNLTVGHPYNIILSDGINEVTRAVISTK